MGLSKKIDLKGPKFLMGRSKKIDFKVMYLSKHITHQQLLLSNFKTASGREVRKWNTKSEGHRWNVCQVYTNVKCSNIILCYSGWWVNKNTYGLINLQITYIWNTNFFSILISFCTKIGIPISTNINYLKS
jgi:hypothetical protein